ncbi:MAG: hypothetical protein K1X64_00720 [Myxococcaceae bacterium]|nr:hypothetical protein [Myxococcaceae bacterium]
MESFIPPGHPGDFVWRLPLIRALQALNALKGTAQERALAAAKKGGFLSSHLIEAGVPADKVLAAMSAATGMPTAPPHEVRRPALDMADVATQETCRALLAVPFKREKDVLHIAYLVPPSADQTAVFPLHAAQVALEADIRIGLHALYGPQTKGPRTMAAATAPMTAPQLGAPTEAMTRPMAAATHQGRVVAKERGAPTAQEMAAAGLIETGVSPFDENMMKLKALRTPVLVLGVVGVVIWGIGRFINVSRDEVGAKGEQLNQAIRENVRDTVKDKQNEMGGEPTGAVIGGQDNVASLVRTQAQLDVAINQSDTVGFYGACTDFSKQLALYVLRAPTLQQQGDLKALSLEATVMCETTPENAVPTERWRDFKGRLGRVMQGENPLPGPRYQTDMPAAVLAATRKVDDLVQGENAEAICKAIDEWRAAMRPWVDRFPPGARLSRMHRTVEALEGFMLGCTQFPVDSLRTSWERMKRDVGPSTE